MLPFLRDKGLHFLEKITVAERLIGHAVSTRRTIYQVFILSHIPRELASRLVEDVPMHPGM